MTRATGSGAEGTVSRLPRCHKLQIVDHDVPHIVHINGVLHCIKHVINVGGAVISEKPEREAGERVRCLVKERIRAVLEGYSPVLLQHFGS